MKEKKVKQNVDSKKNNFFKRYIKTIILLFIAVALIIFFITSPSKNEVKEVEGNKDLIQKVENKKNDITQEVILKNDLSKILQENLNNANLEVKKIYFSDEMLYLEISKKIEEEILEENLKEKILKRIEKDFSVSEVKFITE